MWAHHVVPSLVSITTPLTHYLKSGHFFVGPNGVRIREVQL